MPQVDSIEYQSPGEAIAYSFELRRGGKTVWGPTTANYSTQYFSPVNVTADKFVFSLTGVKTAGHRITLIVEGKTFDLTNSRIPPDGRIQGEIGVMGGTSPGLGNIGLLILGGLILWGFFGKKKRKK